MRDRDGREVDFLLIRNQKPVLLVEAKISDVNPSDSLKRFQRKLGVPAVQLVNQPNVRRLVRDDSREILVCTAHDWLASLP